MLALGNQGTGNPESNFLLQKKLTKVNPYLQHFTFTIDGSLTNSR
jgi:hypothetical protein